MPLNSVASNTAFRNASRLSTRHDPLHSHRREIGIMRHSEWTRPEKPLCAIPVSRNHGSTKGVGRIVEHARTITTCTSKDSMCLRSPET
jgi:hypothetical protein